MSVSYTYDLSVRSRMRMLNAFFYLHGPLFRELGDPSVFEKLARYCPRQRRGFVRPPMCPMSPTIPSFILPMYYAFSNVFDNYYFSMQLLHIMSCAKEVENCNDSLSLKIAKERLNVKERRKKSHFWPDVCMYVCKEVALCGNAYRIGRYKWAWGRGPSKKWVQCTNPAGAIGPASRTLTHTNAWLCAFCANFTPGS